MGIKKFIKQAKYTLGLNNYELEGKKKSLKDLLKRLRERKRNIKNSLEKKELKEELHIVSLQIKKGKKMLHGLYAHKNKDVKK